MEKDVREVIIREYGAGVAGRIAAIAVERAEAGDATPEQMELYHCIMAEVWSHKTEKKVDEITAEAKEKGEIAGFFMSLGKAIQGKRVDNKFLRSGHGKKNRR
jgi:hypothetical protein